MYSEILGGEEALKKHPVAFNVHPKRFGERLRLKATGEVVLSAGSVGTPHILLLSGIGDIDHLKEVGAVL